MKTLPTIVGIPSTIRTLFLEMAPTVSATNQHIVTVLREATDATNRLCPVSIQCIDRTGRMQR